MGDAAWAELAEVVGSIDGSFDAADSTAGRNPHQHGGAGEQTPISPAAAAAAALVILLACPRQRERTTASPTTAATVLTMERCCTATTTCVVQVMSSSSSSSVPSREGIDADDPVVAAVPVVRIHPLLYEFLSLAAEAAAAANSFLDGAIEPRQSPTLLLPPVDQRATGILESSSISNNSSNTAAGVSLAPIPFGCFDVDVADSARIATSCCCWYAQQVSAAAIQDLPPNSQVMLQIITMLPESDNNSSIYDDDEDEDDTNIAKRMSLALQGRLILKGSTVLLTEAASSSSSAINGCNGAVRYIVAVINDIIVGTTRTVTDPLVVYRVAGVPDSFTVEIIPFSRTATLDNDAGDDNQPPQQQQRQEDEITECPGYESLQEELMHLLQLTTAAATSTDDDDDDRAAVALSLSAAPSGILLTGCAGVGKTRLAAAACSRFVSSLRLGNINNNNKAVHWVSVHDLVLQAAWATEDVLMAALTPSAATGVLVLDDLDAAVNEEQPSNDHERRLVRNSILQVMDQLVVQQRAVAILGLGRDVSQLAAELVKVGRLEKEVTMLPPSQTQRELILYSILVQLLTGTATENEDVRCRRCQEWAELLATMTGGCVAADLRRLCADAWNRSLARNVATEDMDSLNLLDLADHASPENAPLTWDDLSEAARNCVPSQLAALDVTKPRNFLESCSKDDWARIHELSWSSFAGYASTKKRVYRTVVVPWRRLLSRDASVLLPGSITPPSGILFHGPSGCGKSFAAICLGSSLGLPMIKVRAADVLDKWLGGSEAAIRSLFSRARAAAPSILFFDEIDAVASNRANVEDGATADVMSRLLSTLLNEMDGVSSGQQARVLVVACTNRLETLDVALLRPGRLEEHILLPKPLLDDAKDLLKQCLALAPLHESVDLDKIAQDLVDRSASGADIEGTCRESIFRALRRCPRDPSDASITTDDIKGAMAVMKL